MAFCAIAPSSTRPNRGAPRVASSTYAFAPVLVHAIRGVPRSRSRSAGQAPSLNFSVRHAGALNLRVQVPSWQLGFRPGSYLSSTKGNRGAEALGTKRPKGT